MNDAGDSLVQFGELLQEASKRLGIISRGDAERVLMRHVRECIEPSLANQLEKDARVLDVGSGGGLPGLALAILRGDIHVTLVEPREKKAAFLERAILKLRLGNAVVAQSTLEEFSLTNPPEFNIAIARAVSWTRPMIKALSTLVVSSGSLIRFGSPNPHIPSVTILPLTQGPRALQVWPRSSWPDLPDAP